jgi:hypothetical protein
MKLRGYTLAEAKKILKNDKVNFSFMDVNKIKSIEHDESDKGRCMFIVRFEDSAYLVDLNPIRNLGNRPSIKL